MLALGDAVEHRGTIAGIFDAGLECGHLGVGPEPHHQALGLAQAGGVVHVEGRREVHKTSELAGERGEPEWVGFDPEIYDYRPVTVTGTFLPAQSVLVFTSLSDAV